MAHITKEEVKAIREQLKKAFPTYKFSIKNAHHSEVIISLMKSDLDLENDIVETHYSKEVSEYIKNGIDKGHFNINYYYLDRNWKGKSLDTFSKVYEIAKSQGWYDKSDSQADYFDTAYYISINVGQWDKPYEKL